MTNRVRNPEKALVRTALRFEKEPVEAFLKMKRIGEQEGYLFILDALCTLESLHEDNTDTMALLTVLRMPEWQVYRISAEEPRYCFGVVDDGEFEPRGIYVNYRDGRGSCVLQYSDEPLLDKAEGVFEGYAPNRLRKMIYKKGHRYFIIKTGRQLDLYLAGHVPSEIISVRGKGYLGKRYQAYVPISKPFYTKDLAQTHFSNITE